MVKWIQGWIKYYQMKRWMDERASCAAVKMAVTGAIKVHP